MYFPQLTFPRFIAAFIVLLTHFANIKEVLAVPAIGNILRYANTLLSFFFVLTGFVLILSIKRDGRMPSALPTKLLLFSRLIRLLPLHWLALVLMLLIQQLKLMYGSGNAAPIEGSKVFLHALLLQAWYPEVSVMFLYNYVSWTLCVEILLIVLAPWLYGWMLKQPTTVLLRNVTLIWLGSLLVHRICIQLGMPLDWGFCWPPIHIPEFMAGMGGGFLVSRHLPALNERAKWIHLFAYLNGALMIGLLCADIPYLFKNSLVFAPSYLIILISIVLSDNWLTRLFCTKPMMYLGKISYAVYILQLPVAVLILEWVHHRINWPYRYSALVFILLLTAVAAMAYEWLEKPIANYAKARMMRPVVAPAESSVVA